MMTLESKRWRSKAAEWYWRSAQQCPGQSLGHKMVDFQNKSIRVSLVVLDVSTQMFLYKLWKAFSSLLLTCQEAEQEQHDVILTHLVWSLVNSSSPRASSKSSPALAVPDSVWYGRMTVPRAPELRTTVNSIVPTLSLTRTIRSLNVKMPAWSSSRIVTVATRGSTKRALGAAPTSSLSNIPSASPTRKFNRRTKKCSSSSNMSSSIMPI